MRAQHEDSPSEAKKLPTGRLYSTAGRGFVPNVRRDLYAKLLAALELQGSEGADATAYVYPATYDEIAPGHLVLGSLFEQSGQTDDALQEYQLIPELTTDDSVAGPARARIAALSS